MREETRIRYTRLVAARSQIVAKRQSPEFNNVTQRTPTIDDISPVTTEPPISSKALDETKQAETESRGVRLASNLLEQKHTLIDIMFSVIGLVVFALYLIFVVVLLCLFLSKQAFSQLPITAVVLVAMTGSVPTILSISLLVGLLSNKDGGKDKDDKSSIDIATMVKITSEVAKHSKNH